MENSPSRKIPRFKFSDILSYVKEPENIFTLLFLLNKNHKFKIYKAIHNESREIFTIKIIQFENNIENTKQIFEKLHQEILLSKISNKSEFISKYYGSYFSHNSNSIWLIFEYFCCGSTIDLMNQMNRALKENEIAVIINLVLHSLIYLHQINIFHKNLKASKILLKSNGIIKLNDLSKSIQILDNKNQQILLNETKNDIFLLGITCIELFKGPYDEKSYNKLTSNLDSSIKHLDDIINIKKECTQEFADFLKICLNSKNNNENNIDCYKLINHPFIKKNNNEKNKEDLSKLIKNYYEGIEHHKKEIYIENNNINHTKTFSSITSPFKSSKHQNNSSFAEKENGDHFHIDENKCNNFNDSNILSNNEDKLAEFRLEQMQSDRLDDIDEYTNKDELFEDKERITDQDYHFETTKNIYRLINKQNNKFLSNQNDQKKNIKSNKDINFDFNLNNNKIQKNDDIKNTTNLSIYSDFDEEFKKNLDHLNKYNNILKSQNESMDNNTVANKFDSSKINHLYYKMINELSNKNLSNNITTIMQNEKEEEESNPSTSNKKNILFVKTNVENFNILSNHNKKKRKSSQCFESNFIKRKKNKKISKNKPNFRNDYIRKTISIDYIKNIINRKKKVSSLDNKNFLERKNETEISLKKSKDILSGFNSLYCYKNNISYLKDNANSFSIRNNKLQNKNSVLLYSNLLTSYSSNEHFNNSSSNYYYTENLATTHEKSKLTYIKPQIRFFKQTNINTANNSIGKNLKNKIILKNSNHKKAKSFNNVSFTFHRHNYITNNKIGNEVNKNFKLHKKLINNVKKLYPNSVINKNEFFKLKRSSNSFDAKALDNNKIIKKKTPVKKLDKISNKTKDKVFKISLQSNVIKKTEIIKSKKISGIKTNLKEDKKINKIKKLIGFNELKNFCLKRKIIDKNEFNGYSLISPKEPEANKIYKTQNIENKKKKYFP